MFLLQQKSKSQVWKSLIAAFLFTIRELRERRGTGTGKESRRIEKEKDKRRLGGGEGERGSMSTNFS